MIRAALITIVAVNAAVALAEPALFYTASGGGSALTELALEAGQSATVELHMNTDGVGIMTYDIFVLDPDGDALTLSDVGEDPDGLFVMSGFIEATNRFSGFAFAAVASSDLHLATLTITQTTPAGQTQLGAFEGSVLSDASATVVPHVVTTVTVAADPSQPPTDPPAPTDPNEPATDPNEPVTDPNEPVIDPNEPVADPNEPATDPNDPAPDPNEPDNGDDPSDEKPSGGLCGAGATPAALVVLLGLTGMRATTRRRRAGSGS